jgi:hypothetical protein
MLLLYQFFNLSNQSWQVRTGEAHLRCRDAVVSDVGWNMLVMRKCWSEYWIVRVRKVVVPVQSFFAPIDFVAIGRNQSRIKVQFFSDTQSNLVGEEKLSFGKPCIRAVGLDSQRRAFHSRMAGEFNHKTAIVGE